MKSLPVERPLRILAVGQTIPPMVRPIQYLLKEKVEVICISYENPFPGDPPAGFQFIPFSQTKRVDNERFLNDHQALNAQAAIEGLFIREIFETYRCDLVHAFGLRFEAACCAKAGIKPLVISIWGELEYLCSPDAYVLPVWQQETLASANTVLVEPPCLKPVVQSLTKASMQLHIWHPGVNLALFKQGYSDNVRQWRRILQLPDDSAVIFSGRGWGATYHQDLILEAFLKAQPHFDQPAYLLFIKMGRMYNETQLEQSYQQLQETAESKGAGKYLRWLPALPQQLMMPIYNLADLVISYKSPDTLPSTVLEAIACQRPVIAPNLPIFKGTPIEEYAELVEPEAPDALAEAIIRLMNKPKMLEPLAAGRSALMAAYDQPIVTERLLGFYQQALNQVSY